MAIEVGGDRTGRDGGRLGEVHPGRRRRVDQPVHPAVAGVGAVVEVGDHVDDPVAARIAGGKGTGIREEQPKLMEAIVDVVAAVRDPGS